ncbi:MAG: zf-HC2 domain-containing protein [Planctomycetota bacterium]|nr:zf-HC2 domain-containing protein [Planctomycetota bacterium]
MHDQGSWNDCPSGAVSAMVTQLRRRKRLAQLRPIMAIGIFVLLFSAIGYGLTNRDDPESRAGLNCRETVPLLAKYHDQSLEAAVATDVREHLSHCPSCRKHYEEMYPSEVRNPLSTPIRLAAIASHFYR